MPNRTIAAGVAISRRRVIAAAAVGAMLGGLPAVHSRANVSVWVVNTGTFTDSNNWSNGVPGSGDVAIFRRGNIGYNVTFPGTTPSTNHYVNDSLRIGDNLPI